MASSIIATLRSKSMMEQLELLGALRSHVMNDGFINLLQNYDLNSKKKDKALQMQLNAFSGIPGLNEQIAKWLVSCEVNHTYYT
jgi:hypothetical protein